ncbi:hypothetical protein CRUP_024717, partial [Coryphaenoides rupestris]
QNYISDAAVRLGEPRLEGGPSRAALSLPFCLNLWLEPEPSNASHPGSSSKEWVVEMGVYAKLPLQEGLLFGPFVGELVRGALQTNLANAWILNHQIYYKTSKPIAERAELKVRIGEDYAEILCLDTGDTRCDFGEKESILRLYLDVQLVTLEEPSSSLWFNHSQSQDAMPIIHKELKTF